MPIDVDLIKRIREETGAGVLEVKQALENNGGDEQKAKEELAKKGIAKAAKKQDRETKDGLVYAYVHANGKIGSMISLACETDFVARTEDFKKLCHELALQAATEEYPSIESFLAAEYVRDPSKKISDLIAAVTAKVGEKIELKNFVRLSVLG
ncbi:MAG TPA: translation elongation factor Ts [Candidatus Saccharimonadales bacterium]|nr:translation elongation factor Ts [Candidatus Saccharimonadales bacterium]